jgi:hypothetical protein
MVELEMHIRLNEGMRYTVLCPYESIRCRAMGAGLTIFRESLKEVLDKTGAFPCIGDSCIIYPCERVRNFAEGEPIDG